MPSVRLQLSRGSGDLRPWPDGLAALWNFSSDQGLLAVFPLCLFAALYFSLSLALFPRSSAFSLCLPFLLIPLLELFICLRFLQKLSWLPACIAVPLLLLWSLFSEPPLLLPGGCGSQDCRVTTRLVWPQILMCHSLDRHHGHCYFLLLVTGPPHSTSHRDRQGKTTQKKPFCRGCYDNTVSWQPAGLASNHSRPTRKGRMVFAHWSRHCLFPPSYNSSSAIGAVRCSPSGLGTLMPGKVWKVLGLRFRNGSCATAAGSCSCQVASSEHLRTV